MHYMDAKKKKLDGNYTRMLQAILNKSWRQHPIKQQLYSHLPPIMKTIKIRWTRHVGHYWRSRNELISDVFLWTPSCGLAWQDDQLQPTYNSSMPIQDVALKTCRKQWTIGRGGERVRNICADSTTWWWWWFVNSYWPLAKTLSLREQGMRYTTLYFHSLYWWNIILLKRIIDFTAFITVYELNPIYCQTKRNQNKIFLTQYFLCYFLLANWYSILTVIFFLYWLFNKNLISQHWIFTATFFF